MPVRVYVHLTWTTLQRQPLINSEVADFLRRFLPKEAQRHGARVLEAGIVADHVHLVLQLLPVINIPRLVQGLKGASARLPIGTASRRGHRCAGRRATTCGAWGCANSEP